MAKAIRFDYFKVYARQYNQEKDLVEDGICDLTDVLTQIQEMPVKDRIYRVGGDQARLQDIRIQNNKWEMHFVRIRKNGFPIKTNDDGTYGFLDDLGEDEGLGEEISVLYDSKNHIIMVRRNMHSLSPSAIANYLTDVVNEPGFTVYFRPLVHPKAIELLKKEHLIRGALVSIADVKGAASSTKRSLGQIISQADEMDESVGVTFKIGIQRKGSKKYSRLPVYEELMAIAKDPNVTKLEVRKKADEDAKSETVDLIRHRLLDYYNFPDNDISPISRNILHATVISRMCELYASRVDDINNVYV